MAGTSHLPVESYTVIATTAAPVAANPTPYDNTKEVLLYNMDGANRLLVKWGDPAVETALTMTTANSLIIPAGGTASLAIGPVGERQYQGDYVQDPFVAGPFQNLLFRGEVADVEVNVSYVQCRGYTGPGC